MFLNLLELMAMFLSVLENVSSTLLSISPKFWPYQLPAILQYFVLMNFFLLIYYDSFTDIAIGENAANDIINKMV